MCRRSSPYTEGFGAVKTVTVGGCTSRGTANTGAKRSYFYMELNGGTSTDADEVIHIVVVDTEDGADPRVARHRQIWGLNDDSMVVRQGLIEDPTETTQAVWATSNKFNTDLRITETRMPSAHTGVDSDADVKKFLNPTSIPPQVPTTPTRLVLAPAWYTTTSTAAVSGTAST